MMQKTPTPILIVIGSALLAISGCSTTFENVASITHPLITTQEAENADTPAAYAQFIFTNGTVPYNTPVTGRSYKSTTGALTVDLKLVWHGLDQRSLTYDFGNFSVPANGSTDVPIYSDQFLVQSTAHESQYELQAQFQAPTSAGPVISSEPLFAQFATNYSTVTFGSSTADVWRPDPPTTYATWSQFWANVSPYWSAGISGRFSRVGGWSTVSGDSRQQSVDGNAMVDETVGFQGITAQFYKAFLPTTPIHTWDPLNSYRVCMTYAASFNDAGTGQGLIDAQGIQKVPAAFSRGRITNSSGTILFDGYLDGLGCTTQTAMSALGNYTFFLYSRLENATPSDYSVEWGDPDPAPHLPPRVRDWSHLGVVKFTPTGPNGSTITINDTLNDAPSRVAAVVTQAYNASDNALIANSLYLAKANRGCLNAAGTTFCIETDMANGLCFQACFDTGASPTMTLNVGPSASGPAMHFMKNVIAHELGHQVQHFSFGDQNDSYSALSPQNGITDPACRCDYVTSANKFHCLDSKEDQGFGSHEGFAHFYAARILNAPASSTPQFIYYKEAWSGTITPFAPPFAVNPLQYQKWMENNCTTNPQTNKGVEADWMSFYYNTNVASSNNTSLTDLGDIYRRACGTSPTNCNQQNVQWTNLDTSAQNKWGVFSAHYNLFSGDALLAGIEH